MYGAFHLARHFEKMKKNYCSFFDFVHLLNLWYEKCRQDPEFSKSEFESIVDANDAEKTIAEIGKLKAKGFPKPDASMCQSTQKESKSE